MKWNSMRIVLTLLACVPGLTITAAAQHHSDRHCSLAGAAGKWAFTITGSIPAIGPVGAVGKFSQDASGNVTGTETRSLNGDIADETLTGTATVNSDCSGTYTFQVFEGGVLARTSTIDVIFDDNGSQARALFTSVVLPDGTSLPSILTVEARRLFPKD